MNIGIVTTWFERGAAYVSRQYMDALKSNPANTVYVYARGGESYAKGDKKWDTEGVTWGKPSKKYYAGVTSIDKQDFHQWINKNAIDIILFNEQNWWIPVLWCKEWGVKTGTYVDYYTEETVPLFAAYDFILCNTERHFRLFKDLSQSYYIPWGTDTNLFKVDDRKQRKEVVFFHSSGMNPHRKGTECTLRAFLSLKDLSAARLIIHTQIPLAAELQKLIDNSNQKVELIVDTVTAPGLYHTGDVYVYPSILDGLGLTVAEALSCGLPCIVPNNAPMNEFVKEDFLGRIASVEYLYARSDGYYWPQCKVSIDSVKQQMQYYIENKLNLAEIQQKVRRYAEENYNWEDRYNMINQIFSEVKVLPLGNDTKMSIEQYERRNNGKFNIIPYLFYYWKKYRK